jgi:8-oxo-dGTP pyrophosphatase MutT (NUDIX family)
MNSQAPRRFNSSTGSDGPEKNKVPSVPRPSASLLLVNKNDEVSSCPPVRQRPRCRCDTHSSHIRPGVDDSTNTIHQELCRAAREPLSCYPSEGLTLPTQAFPGGTFDPKQDADFQMTALRETFEETGILLVESPTTNTNTNTNAPYPTTEQLAAARLAIHSRTDPLTWPDFLARYRLQAPVDKLIPFSQWVTPESVPVRFHTRFYVLFVEELANGVVKQQARPPNANGDGKHDGGAPPPPPPTPKGEDADVVLVQNPTGDGGVEVISASWAHPRDLFAAFRRGELTLFPPQFYLLTTLRHLLDSMHQESNRAEVLRARIGGFGSRLFRPRPSGFTEEGGKGRRSVLTYEGDEMRGGKAGDRHRSLILNQGRVSRRPPVSCSSLLLTLSEESSRY